MTADNDELLIDHMYRMTFGKPVPEWTSNKAMRQALSAAHRFVLDDRMSAFLADLDTACLNLTVPYDHEVKSRLLLNLRPMARLARQVLWIEFNALIYSKRIKQLANEPELCLIADEMHLDTIREGWLLDTRPSDNQLFRIHAFRSYQNSSKIWLYPWPFTLLWRTDQKDLSGGRTSKTPTKEIAPQLFGVRQIPESLYSYIAIGRPELVREWDLAFSKDDMSWVHGNMAVGLLRRVWSLLATINDIPVMYQSPTRTAKGFMAKAQYRRYLEHKVITLTVPQRYDSRKLARHVVAIAKRRAHTVRGHWRKDYFHPLTPFCVHEFEPAGQHLVCRRCGGQKIWIAQHIRGDASVGYVIHDYAVKHGQQQGAER